MRLNALLLVAIARWAFCTNLRDNLRDREIGLQALLNLRGEAWEMETATPAPPSAPAPGPVPEPAPAPMFYTAAAQFDVGTEPGKANVVSDFEVVGTWISGDDLGASPTVMIPTTQFYIRSRGGSLNLTKVSVSPSNLLYLETSIGGNLTTEIEEKGNVALRPNDEYNITIIYTCKSTGSANLVVTLDFHDLSPVQIPLTKTCGGEPNTCFSVTMAGESQPAVVMGIPKYDELKVVGVRNKWANLTLYNEPLCERGDQVIATPVAKGIGSCSAAVVMPQGPKQFTLLAGEALKVPVKYNCFRSGNCAITMKVSFVPDMAPFQPLRWSWTKLCGGSALGIDVRGEVEKGNELSRVLVSDGASVRSHSFLPWLVDTDTNLNKLFLTNDVQRSLEPEVFVRSLRVRCLDSIRCTARISEKVPKLLVSSSPAEVNVEYSCLTSGSSIIEFMLVIDGHDPVTTTWAKDCHAFVDSIYGVFLIVFSAAATLSLAFYGMQKLCGDSGKEDPGRAYDSDLDDAEHLARENNPFVTREYGSAPGTSQSLASA